MPSRRARTLPTHDGHIIIIISFFFTVIIEYYHCYYRYNICYRLSLLSVTIWRPRGPGPLFCPPTARRVSDGPKIRSGPPSRNRSIHCLPTGPSPLSLCIRPAYRVRYTRGINHENNNNNYNKNARPTNPAETLLLPPPRRGGLLLLLLLHET